MSAAVYALAKRTLDFALATLLLALCAPLALVALAPARTRFLPRFT